MILFKSLKYRANETLKGAAEQGTKFLHFQLVKYSDNKLLRQAQVPSLSNVYLSINRM